MNGFGEVDVFDSDLGIVDKEILKAAMRVSPHPLDSAVRQLVEVGGKRIRPLLVVLSFRSLDEETDINYAAPIAAAVELIHTATLIHDDIIDRSSKRRGRETVFKKWGEEAAILSGDLLFSKAFGLVGVHEIKELTRVISESCIKLSEGEMLEYRHTRNTSMTEEIYLEIIERKTASLFEASTRCGGLLGGGSEKEINALSRFGSYLGVSFQIVDDVLDLTADEEFGKPKAIDIREGKVTIAALHALKNTQKTPRKTLDAIIRKKRKNKKDIEIASAIIKSAGSIEHAFKRAEEFGKKARAELDVLPDSKAKTRLMSIADSVIYRPF